MFGSKEKKIEKIKALFKAMDAEKASEVLFDIIVQKTGMMPPDESLKFLFDFDNKIYALTGQESIRYGNGVHTKHKHIRYHDFFINNIGPGSRVLDVGCGSGVLSYDIAEKVPDVNVCGIDIYEDYINIAKRDFKHKNIRYICGDALEKLPDEEYDIIILSNVLEHIEHRVDFLKKLNKIFSPEKFLIRVPVFERDWKVPLKKELGIDYRLDKTHYIEYFQEEFFDEIKQSGLFVKSHKINWGEIWAVVVAG